MKFRIKEVIKISESGFRYNPQYYPQVKRFLFWRYIGRYPNRIVSSDLIRDDIYHCCDSMDTANDRIRYYQMSHAESVTPKIRVEINYYKPELIKKKIV